MDLIGIEMSLIKACLMLSRFSFETSSLLGSLALRSPSRLNTYVKFVDNQSVICPAVCTTHDLCHFNILYICSPHYDIVYEIPVS